MRLTHSALIIAAMVAMPALSEDIFKFSGSAEVNYIYTDDGSNGANNPSSQLDRALLLNIDAAKAINGDLKMGARISQKIVTGDTRTDKTGFGSREAYAFVSGDFGTVKAGRIFINSYLTLDWPFGQVGFWPVAEAGAGKVTGVVYLPNSISYQSPTFGGMLSFTAQHGWGNVKHSRDSVFDLAATLTLNKRATLYAGVLSNKPTTSTSVTTADPTTHVVTTTTTERNDIENKQAYLGASVNVIDPLTLRAVYQTYSQDDKGTEVNKGKELSLGATYSMGSAGYLKAAYLNQDNTGDANDFTRAALQYGHDIGGGAEWYIRVMQQNPKQGEKLNQFLTGVWIGF